MAFRRISFTHIGVVTLCNKRCTANAAPNQRSSSPSSNRILAPQGWTQERIEAELLAPQEAQKLTVYHEKKVLSYEEIEKIMMFEASQRMLLGKTQRDAEGFKKMDATWYTTYLQTNRAFQSAFPEIVERLITTARRADQAQNWGILSVEDEDVRVRVIELHRVRPGGALPDTRHLDRGSLITIDAMLSDASGFLGGVFSTLEENGLQQPHEFTKGDVVVFPSHKYHCVQPVENGERVVLVMELWRGEERDCAHRCMQYLGDCGFSVASSMAEILFTSALPEVDPW